MTYTPNGGSAQTVLSGLSYTGLAGAMGSPTSGLLGPGSGVYAFSLGVDNNGRATSASVTNLGGTVTKFSQTRSFDALGNVITTNTTLPDGTDNQTFCYDDLNRLTWAGSTGTPNCGRSLTAGTLTSAQYQQTYGYDTLDRLTQGPIGSGYTYSSGHLHAASIAGSGVNTYTAAYDAAGEQTCRATSNAQTCAGTPTGQTMTYDHLNRLLTWQNAVSSPTSTASYAYEGSGERVQQVVTNSGTTTTTRYIGAYEELATTGGTTTTTTYYPAGPFILEVQNGTISYLVKDLLGHVTVSLDTSGNVTAQQLYSPYGTFRYSHNSLPTSYSFTGQRADASGLLYFHARYYDPVLGQFTSADTVQGPNRYGYVGGNPETVTDPSGHCGISKRCFDGGSFLPCGNTRNPYGGSCSDATPGNNPYWNQAVAAADCSGLCAAALAVTAVMAIAAPFYVLNAAAQMLNAPGIVQAITGALATASGENGIGSALMAAGNALSPPMPADSVLSSTGRSDAGTRIGPKPALQPSIDAGGALPANSGNGNNSITLYRGTSTASVQDVVANQALDVKRIRSVQVTSSRGPGFYFSTQYETALYWSGLVVVGGGPGIFSATIDSAAFESFVLKHGILHNVPVLNAPIQQVETLIPFELAGELDQIATYKSVFETTSWFGGSMP